MNYQVDNEAESKNCCVIMNGYWGASRALLFIHPRIVLTTAHPTRRITRKHRLYCVLDSYVYCIFLNDMPFLLLIILRPLLTQISAYLKIMIYPSTWYMNVDAGEKCLARANQLFLFSQARSKNKNECVVIASVVAHWNYGRDAQYPCNTYYIYVIM